MKYELPEEIVARFRTSALERIAAVDHAWAQLTTGSPSAEVERELHRQVHTLKGDSRVVGFTDVNHLCQKLEDLLFFASQRGFRVPDEIDNLVTMSLQFIGMLIRKKIGASLGGIDLAGFTRQIEEALRDAEQVVRSDVRALPAESQGPGLDESDRLSAATRRRMALAATSVFVESLRVSGQSGERLRATWRNLASALRALDGTPLDPILARHRAGTAELARSLGKKVELELPSSQLRVCAQLAEAIDVVLLHGIANALDHGVEPPERRTAAGKPEQARITVSLRELPHSLELTLQDDGGGVDLERVRNRALAMGLLHEHEARGPTGPKQLLDLLFHPGFSTREQVGAVSGRGIGLNAVRAALTRVGGTVEIRSDAGRGTALSARLPRTAGQLSVTRVTLAGTRIPLAIPATHPLTAERGAPRFVDVGAVLGLAVVDRSSSADSRVFFVGSGEQRLRLVSSSPPVVTRAERLCPTGEEDAFEVVSVAGVESLLVRPSALLGSPSELLQPPGLAAAPASWPLAQGA